MLKKHLQQLNLSEKEISVYLTLIELGPSKARDISRKTELNRTTIYDVTEELLQKGLISKYKKSGATVFTPKDPKTLLNYLEREKEEKINKIDRQKEKVRELLPQLVSLQNIYSKSRPKVQFFESEKGMREAYEDTLSAREPILAYANAETMHQGLPNFFPEYYKRRARNKIFIKAIIPQNEINIERTKVNQEEMRETRFLPEPTMTFSPEVNLYNDKMLIASWKEKMAIIIESREFVKLQKLTFNILWNKLSKNI